MQSAPEQKHDPSRTTGRVGLSEVPTIFPPISVRAFQLRFLHVLAVEAVNRPNRSEQVTDRQLRDHRRLDRHAVISGELNSVRDFARDVSQNLRD
jgi:hypothetical protein